MAALRLAALCASALESSSNQESEAAGLGVYQESPFRLCEGSPEQGRTFQFGLHVDENNQ